ncbi:hypothetical protein [Streptosporangium sp. KLBMP 9127]|nr:hypothetical protein [Streptosporangium sp. KLBMP 9127]
MARPHDPAPMRLPLDVSPAGMVRREGEFHGEHTTLMEALSGAIEELTALGAFWGADEDGQTFYQGADGTNGYRAATAEAEKHVQSIGGAYLEIGENIAIMGANLQGANWATVVGMVGAVRGGVPGVETQAQVG